MQAKHVVETESAPSAHTDAPPLRKSRRFLLIAVAVIIALSVCVYGVLAHYSGMTATLGSKAIKLEVVNTPATRERGLSGRESLREDRGMLFVFDEPGDYCFWMKDMHFPIDIIWLDGQKRVIGIEKNLAPSTYPNSFCPKSRAEYVIEVAAGVADKSGLKAGDPVRIHSDLML